LPSGGGKTADGEIHDGSSGVCFLIRLAMASLLPEVAPAGPQSGGLRRGLWSTLSSNVEFPIASSLARAMKSLPPEDAPAGPQSGGLRRGLWSTLGDKGLLSD